jgi:superfamily II DNA/RNA helicase
MEAIAAAFALDVPSVALLVLPAEASVQRAIYDLRQLGVTAVGLDLLDAQHGQRELLHGSSDSTRDQPILLVSTFATVRGIDLPELTHVFMLGVPNDRRVDTYLHVAGRVGRFGRGGRVIAVLEKNDETSAAEKGKQQQRKDFNDQSRRMGMIYRDLGITPTRFEHFD